MRQGHSRIPVYTKDRTDASKYIMIKELLTIDPDDNVPLKCMLMLPFAARRNT